MNARDTILARVRGAVSDVSAPIGSRGPVPVIEEPSPGTAESVQMFVDRVVDYQATVVRTTPERIGAAVAGALTMAGAESVVLPAGLDPTWTAELGEGIRRVADEALSSSTLDAVDAVVTACAVGIATTGTIVLDHRDDQGRRALSLVPDMHVCVVREEQVVHDVPEAVARLHPGDGMPRPLTWISGPSATSDIELDRVEGVHGPRRLHVLLIEG
ncbi:MAG: LutC/YkgG family protein [Dermatophilaceae bacterium]